MAKDVTIWYDQEGDYLEVLFERKEGYFRETENDAIMEKVDREGHVTGFSILDVSTTKNRAPVSITLRDAAAGLLPTGGPWPSSMTRVAVLK